MHEIFLDELKKLNTQFMEMGVFVNDEIDHTTRAFEFTTAHFIVRHIHIKESYPKCMYQLMEVFYVMNIRDALL